jgi:putative hydrolase of the HAD superfamily
VLCEDVRVFQKENATMVSEIPDKNNRGGVALKKVLFWDFDGTLGYRIDGLHGRAWSASMLEAINEVYPSSILTIEDISPHLRQGFPWHESEKGHTHLHSADLWWQHIKGIFELIFIKLGFTTVQSRELAITAQKRYVDMSMWQLYEDTLPTLKILMSQGWEHIIVSNHVPELRIIVDHLQLTSYISTIINSAEVGYEKPNPHIYKLALERAVNAEHVWMIGDNIIADVLGPEILGIRGILVRNRDTRAKFQFDNLLEIPDFLKANS